MDGFERLTELGAERISRDTHIAQRNVQLILEKSFDKLQKMQFLGFVSILEREYRIDLSGLKQEYLLYCAQTRNSEGEYEVASEAAKHRLTKKQFVLAAAALLASAVIVLTVVFSGESKPKAQIEVNNTAIEEAKKNLNIASFERNESVDTSGSALVVESAEHGQEAMPDREEADAPEKEAAALADTPPERKEVPSIVPTMPSHLMIVPKGRLWIWLVDLGNQKRRQMVISEPLTLDAQKEWLIYTGHGLLRMENGDTESDFNTKEKLMFLYEKGLLQRIDEEEFKARNKGRLW